MCCSLPLRGSKVNTRYMPTIGNGYLGATIYDDALFLDGVYSGTGCEQTFSHFLVIFSILSRDIKHISNSRLYGPVHSARFDSFRLNSMSGPGQVLNTFRIKLSQDESNRAL